MRCPACNANKAEEYEIGKIIKTDTPILGHRCRLCGATWKGPLVRANEAKGNE